MNNHPDVKFFLKISDRFPNRVEVYQRRYVTQKGWVWNTKTNQIELIKVFDVISANLPDSENHLAMATTVVDSTPVKKENKEFNLSQIKMMNELREALISRREKFKTI